MTSHCFTAGQEARQDDGVKEELSHPEFESWLQIYLSLERALALSELPFLTRKEMEKRLMGCCEDRTGQCP